MPANEAIPFFEPGARLTGHATAAVTGKRFVSISGNAQTDGNYSVAHAAGAKILGVAAYDAALGKKVPIIVGQDIIVPVTAAAALAAGASVTSDATGQAVAVAPGAGVVAHACGVVMTAAAAAGDDAHIRLVQHSVTG